MIESIENSRREFIKTCLRFGVGGGLIFTGIVLNRKETDDTNGCHLISPCHSCSQYNGCKFPKALAVKDVENREGGNRGRE
jgi:hypothetical protein